MNEREMDRAAYAAVGLLQAMRDGGMLLPSMVRSVDDVLARFEAARVARVAEKVAA